MSRLPIFIFDLDGTVSDDKWRHDLLPKGKEGHAMIECDLSAITDPVETDMSYDAYHKRMGEDFTLWPGATVLRAAISKGYTIEFSTARPERFRALAVGWIRAHFGVFNFYVNMRKDGECDGSVKIKREHIKNALGRHGNGPAFFYDDRSDVCAMAQSLGLTAYIAERDCLKAFDGRDVDAAGELDEDMKEAHRKACQPESPATVLACKAFVDSPKETISIGAKIAATEVTETVGEISVKTRTEYALPIDMLPEEAAPTAGRNAADVLQGMADTFRERNKVYGNNAEMVGKVMEVLFPKGVILKTPADYHMWHLFELKIVKLTRFAISGLNHQDSIHDDAVYSAMCELLVGTHSINFKGGQ